MRQISDPDESIVFIIKQINIALLLDVAYLEFKWKKYTRCTFWSEWLFYFCARFKRWL